MFDALSDRLGGVFDGLLGRGALNEKDVTAALREIRVALLEADVALPVVKDFIASIKDKAVGEDVIRSVKPGQQVVKIVHDGLVELLGGEDAETGLRVDNPPAVVMMAGLQGSGKTTTTGKLAKRLSERDKKKVLLASLDTRRPAAMEQLAILADQCGDNVSALPIIKDQSPAEIARRALQAAKLGGHDVLFLDTAGRTSIDEQMMAEASEIAKIASPNETLLVADSLTGQDAVETAKRFHERLPLTGLILTRMDGDGRGGAALSMRAVTGLPIKFLGTGEKLMASTRLMPSAWRAAFSAKATLSRWLKKLATRWTPKKLKRWPRKWPRGSSIWTTSHSSFSKCKKWAVLAGLWGFCPAPRKPNKRSTPLAWMTK